MGRKIDLKKIEDVTKCQVTFSKRRSSLIKKANEIAVCCDVDVALVAFSPSGRVSKYCNKQRIEDVLTRYANLPPESRLTHIEKVQEKMEKLKKLSYMGSDGSKLHYLDKRIENLQLQIKKRSLELQILETDLRDYEVPPEQEPASLHQLSWCERNLNNSLETVTARKMELENRTGLQYSSNINVNELDTQNGQAGDSMMKHDPWNNPYGSKVYGSSSQNFVGQTNIASPNRNHVRPSHMYNLPLPDSSKYANIAAPNMNNAGPSHMYNFPLTDSYKYANTATPNMNHAGPSHMYKFPLTDSSTILESGFTNMTTGAQIPLQQSSIVDPLLQLPDKINADTWNNFSSYVSTPNAAYISTQTSCDFPTPRFTSTTIVTHNACSAEIPQSLYDEMIGTSSQLPNSHFNQFSMEGVETMDKLDMNFRDNLSKPNALHGSLDIDRSGGVNSSQLQQINASFESLQAKKVFCWDTAINVALNGNIDVDRSGGINSSQMQAPSESQPPHNEFFWDTSLNGIIDIDRSARMNSSQMQVPSESLQPEKDFRWDTALNGIIGIDKSGGMNYSQMQAPSGSLQPKHDFVRDTTSKGKIEVDRYGGMTSSQMQQINAPSEQLQPKKDVCQDTIFDNVDQEVMEESTQRNASWDWEDLLFTDNFQFGESSKQL